MHAHASIHAFELSGMAHAKGSPFPFLAPSPRVNERMPPPYALLSLPPLSLPSLLCLPSLSFLDSRGSPNGGPSIAPRPRGPTVAVFRASHVITIAAPMSEGADVAAAVRRLTQLEAGISGRDEICEAEQWKVLLEFPLFEARRREGKKAVSTAHASDAIFIAQVLSSWASQTSRPSSHAACIAPALALLSKACASSPGLCKDAGVFEVRICVAYSSIVALPD